MKLEIGDKIPDFTTVDQHGTVITSSSMIGKKNVLYFYPKDDTPGCTLQACNLRDNIDGLKAAGYAVFGVSIDDEKSHQKFIKKFDLPFTLLADNDKSMVESFGVWVEKSMYGKTYMGTARTTFVTDENNILTKIIEKVDTKDHTNQILS